MSTAITTGSNIVRPSSTTPIVIFQHTDPEKILSGLLQAYIAKTDYNNIFPNFKGINVNTIHPFARFMADEADGKAVDLNLLPSITVSDSSDNEDDVMLSRNQEDIAYDAGKIAFLAANVIDWSKNPDTQYGVVASTNSISRLQQAVIDSGVVVGTVRSYVMSHKVDFNIWTDNKNVTSALYDLVQSFIANNLDAFHDFLIDPVGGISGTRSGDINIEYGKILFGANITAPFKVQNQVTEFDVTTGLITEIDVNPTEHVPT